MSKFIVGIFALGCLAAPLFAAETATAPKDEAPAAATTEKKMEGDKKMAECKHCHKPMSECSCKKKKTKKS